MKNEKKLLYKITVLLSASGVDS